MTKMLIDIDDAALEAAQQAYGTTTKKETVNRALSEVTARIDRAASLRELRRLALEEDAVDMEMLGDKAQYRPGPNAPEPEAGAA